MKTETITVQQAADALGLHVSTVRYGLREGKFPFGTALRMGERYRYVIYPEAFRRLVTGEKDDVV